MLRNSFSLPLRLLQDAAPVQKYTPSHIASTITSQRHRPFSTTDTLEKRRGAIVQQAQKLKKKKHYATPQAKRVADARLRKHVARQTVLREQRAIEHGHFIHGRAEPTEFVKSFDTATVAEPEAAEAGQQPSSSPLSSSPSLLNAFIRADELAENLAISRKMTEPLANTRAGAGDPTAEEQRRRQHEVDHAVAAEALGRILSVEQTSSKQRKHINIQRCIEKFGRHNTDPALYASQAGGADAAAAVPAANALDLEAAADAEALIKQRIGPDTGSSEVQIAILTMKIRKLAVEREGPMRRDLINKRNLRVLLHRRQKLLKYFYKKNRGGPRWQHLVDTLGLTDATWKDEVFLA